MREKENFLSLLPRKWIPAFPFKVEKIDPISYEYQLWKDDIGDKEKDFLNSRDIASLFYYTYNGCSIIV